MTDPEKCGIARAVLITGMSYDVLCRLAREGKIRGTVKTRGAWAFDPDGLAEFNQRALNQAFSDGEARALGRRLPSRSWIAQLPIATGAQDRVYFIGAGDHIKIGLAFQPRTRLMELQVGNPLTLRLLAHIRGGVAAERYLHKFFAKDRVRGEWFRTSPLLCEFIATLSK